MIRIIAGKHKNRIIPILKNSKYRPFTGKIREAIFSILTSGEFISDRLFTNESKVLDLFAGSGSLAFESCSRGAGGATLVDINADYLQAAKEFANKIGELNKINFLNISASSLSKAKDTFDLIFIDPPYYHNLVSKTISSLKKGQWLKNGSIIVVALAKTSVFFHDNSLQIIKEKIYGDSKLLILRY